MVADDTRTTLAWLHNYWSDAYKIERPVLDATLIDAAGHEVATWVIALEPDATEVIDIREQCRSVAVALPFEGQLLLRLAHENVVPGRPVQVFAEYVADGGQATGVHGQYGLVDRPLAQVVSGMRVEAGNGVRTAVVFANSFEGSHGATPMRAELEVRNAAGARRHVHLDRLAPRATQAGLARRRLPRAGRVPRWRDRARPAARPLPDLPDRHLRRVRRRPPHRQPRHRGPHVRPGRGTPDVVDRVVAGGQRHGALHRSPGHRPHLPERVRTHRRRL